MNNIRTDFISIFINIKHLARALSVIEIIAIAYEKVNKYAVLSPLLYAALFYLAFSGVLTVLFQKLEKKLGYYQV